LRRQRQVAHRITTRQAVHHPVQVLAEEIPRIEEELDREELEDNKALHRILREVAFIHRERRRFAEINERSAVERAVREGEAASDELDVFYNRRPNEPKPASLIFGIDVDRELARAQVQGTLNFETKKLIDALRVAARSPDGGASRLALLATVRGVVRHAPSDEVQLSRIEQRLKLEGFTDQVKAVDDINAKDRGPEIDLRAMQTPQARREMVLGHDLVLEHRRGRS